MKLLLALATTLIFTAGAAAAPAAGKTQLTWYGHAAFIVKTPGGTTIAIDPWINNPLNKDKEALDKIGKVDFILISHGHFDHVGDALALQKKTGAKIVGAFELGAALLSAGLPADALSMETRGNIGGTLKLNDQVSVSLVPAVHSSGFQKDENSPALYAGNPVGFVLRIQGGPTIYHTGDTDQFSDMKLIGQRFHPDLILACIGGHFTMGPKGGAQAAREVGAKTIVPMHFGTFPVLTGTPEELAKALKGARVKMMTMAVGETKAL
jgi:L-ascorbate metabolism protein UlaG (beta-lactamase superfamily)